VSQSLGFVVKIVVFGAVPVGKIVT